MQFRAAFVNKGGILTRFFFANYNAFTRQRPLSFTADITLLGFTEVYIITENIPNFSDFQKIKTLFLPEC